MENPMSSVLSAVCFTLVVTGATFAAPVHAHASLEEQAKASVQAPDNRAALTRRYLELTTGGIDKLVQQLVSDELMGIADEMPAEQLEWFRANTVIILRPHMDGLIQSLSDDIQTRFTEAELEALVGFYDTPQGRAIAAKQMEMGGALNQAMQGFQMAYLQDLMTKFCGAFDCEAMTRQAAGGAKPTKR
jgi:hypothetical protein